MFKSNRKNQDVPSVKYYTNQKGIIFGGFKFRGREVNFLSYENVSNCNDYRISDIFRIEGKILQVR